MVGDDVEQESWESLVGDCRPLSPRLRWNGVGYWLEPGKLH